MAQRISAAESLKQTLQQRKRTIRIIGYSAEYAADFARLNYQWIEQYFRVEAEDRAALDYPEAYAVEPGGEIFFLLKETEVVGTVAMVPKAYDDAGEVSRFELAKMAVDPKQQGQGLGKQLLAHAIEYAKNVGAAQVVLSTNNILLPAVAVYRGAGFIEQPAAKDERYERSNTFMVLELT